MEIPKAVPPSSAASSMNFLPLHGQKWVSYRQFITAAVIPSEVSFGRHVNSYPAWSSFARVRELFTGPG